MSCSFLSSFVFYSFHNTIMWQWNEDLFPWFYSNLNVLASPLLFPTVTEHALNGVTFQCHHDPVTGRIQVRANHGRRVDDGLGHWSYSLSRLSAYTNYHYGSGSNLQPIPLKTGLPYSQTQRGHPSSPQPQGQMTDDCQGCHTASNIWKLFFSHWLCYPGSPQLWDLELEN